MGFILYNIKRIIGAPMENFTVEFFEKEDGTFPAEEFILAQDLKMRAKIFRMVELLELKGNDLREPYSKKIAEDIYELRAKQGTDITRILYFFVVGKKIILTNGFVKKSNKTPKNEIKKAIKYKEEYISKGR